MWILLPLNSWAILSHSSLWSSMCFLWVSCSFWSFSKYSASFPSQNVFWFRWILVLVVCWLIPLSFLAYFSILHPIRMCTFRILHNLVLMIVVGQLWSVWRLGGFWGVLLDCCALGRWSWGGWIWDMHLRRCGRWFESLGFLLRDRYRANHVQHYVRRVLLSSVGLLTLVVLVLHGLWCRRIRLILWGCFAWGICRFWGHIVSSHRLYLLILLWVLWLFYVLVLVLVPF